mgnify:CR=1 FL=1
MRAALALALAAPLLAAAKVVPIPEPGGPPATRPIWYQPERDVRARDAGQPIEAAPGLAPRHRVIRVPERPGMNGPDG